MEMANIQESVSTSTPLIEAHSNNQNHDMSSEKYRRVLELDEGADGAIGGGTSSTSGGGVVVTVEDGGVVAEDFAGVAAVSAITANATSSNLMGGGGGGLGVRFGRGKQQWRARTCLERCLLVICLLLLLLVIILIVVLAAQNNGQMNRVVMRQNYTYVLDPDVCLDQSCVQASARILEYLDPSVNPCTDFYKYSCGGWIRSRSIPIGISSYSVFREVADKNELVMRLALEESMNKSKGQAELKSKVYYQSCLNLTGINSRGGQPLLSLLRSRLKGWKSLPTSSAGSPQEGNILDFDSLLNQVMILSDISDLPFFQFVVSEDEKNATVNILQLDQVNVGLSSRDYYLNESNPENKKITDAYKVLMRQIGELLGVKPGVDWYTPVYQFEIELANATMEEDERRDAEKNYNKMTIVELENFCPSIKWLSFFQHQFSKVDIDIAGNESIIVLSKDYLQKMCPILKEYLASPAKKRVVHDYMFWRIIKMYADQLSEPFRRAYLDFIEIFKGVKGEQQEWKSCVERTQVNFDMAVGAMFVRNVFKGNSKAMAHKMIGEIKEAFKANFENVDWMDDETRVLAMRKVNSIKDMIGFPECILNTTALDDKYKSFTVNNNEFFENNVHLTERFWLKYFRRLKEDVKSRWEMSPQTVNAYYQQTKNLIAFPAGILQSPFYNRGYPKSLNYGAVGAVVGHEITHGFDDQGRKYDGYGNLRQWWNNRTVERFIERSKCIVDQYSSYSLYGYKIRGKQTLGENIADNGGIKAAYQAFKRNQKKMGTQPLLPSLNMTHDQLFFLAFGQVWCGKTRSQSVALLIKSDSHTPDELRVRGTLSNSEEFSTAFKCPLGSPMNPIKKCVVW